MVSSLVRVCSLSTLAIIVAACSASSERTADSTSEPLSQHPVRIMKVHHPNGAAPLNQAAGTSATLTYYGGPVISKVRVFAVYWGSGVQNQDHINSFYPAITDSPYFDWLSE